MWHSRHPSHQGGYIPLFFKIPNMLRNYNKLHRGRSAFMALFFGKKNKKEENTVSENTEEIYQEELQEDEIWDMDIDTRIFRTYGLGIFELLQDGIIWGTLNEEKTGGILSYYKSDEHFLDDLEDEERNKNSQNKVNSLDGKIGIAGRSTDRNRIPTIKIKIERYLKEDIDRLLKIKFTGEFYKWHMTESRYEIEIKEERILSFYVQYMIALIAFETDQERLQELLQPDKTKIIPEEKVVHPEEREQKKRKKLTRNKSMLVRLNQNEYDFVQSKIDKAGCTQADYLRAQIMYGSVNQVPASMESIDTLNELKNLAKEFGKVEGMIAKTIRVHEKSYFLSAEEMLDLKNEVKELRKIKKEIKEKVNEWY